MKSLNKIAYDILSTIRPYLTDDEDISLRQIKESVHDIRAQLIRNQLDKNRSIDPDTVQDLGLVAVEEKDTAYKDNETLESSVNSNVSVYRTREKIPALIDLRYDKGLLRVSLKDKTSTPIPVIDYKKVPYIGNGRFNSINHSYCYLLNSRVYFVLKNITLTNDVVNIQGIFQNPVEAAKFNYTEDSVIYTDDLDYPLPRWMITFVKKELLNQFKIPAEAPADRTNDASGEINTVTKRR